MSTLHCAPLPSPTVLLVYCYYTALVNYWYTVESASKYSMQARRICPVVFCVYCNTESVLVYAALSYQCMRP
jgi:hypothetical protein